MLNDRRLSSIASKVVPEGLSVSDFARTTSDEIIERAEHRLRLCARCPTHGGACDSPYERDLGHEPYWDGAVQWRYCSKWPTYLLHERLRSFGVPDLMLNARIDNFEEAPGALALAAELARNFVEMYEGAHQNNKGLLFVGPTGVGKTHLAVGVMRELVRRGHARTAKMVDVARFLEDLRASYDAPLAERKQVIDPLLYADVVLLDDLGAQRTTEWVREQLGIVINERWANRRTMLITTNANLDYFGDTLGERALSRLQDMLLTVMLNGPSRRGT